MKTCLVSLVSDQTIPNILVALHFKPDFLLFFSTKQMEDKGKTKAILETLKLRGLDYFSNHQVFQISENSILDLQQKFSNWSAEAGGQYDYIVNLTCGTKLMSLSAYDLFKEYGSMMVYIPIPRNEFLIPFPKHRPKEPTLLTDRLSVEEYLLAYGFKINNKNHIEKNKSISRDRKQKTKLIMNNYRQLQPILLSFFKQLQPVLNKFPKSGVVVTVDKKIDKEAEKEFLMALGFPPSKEKPSKVVEKSEGKYLCGGWLEEYVFLIVDELLGGKGDIQIGVEAIDNQENKNEFDVIFTFENTLNLIECKSLDPEEGSEFKVGITDFFYKLGALRRNFGLTPKAFLATTSKDIYDQSGLVKSHLLERGKQFNITLITLDQLKDLPEFLLKQL
ncbi:MAG: DUF1887 family CARF protein [Thermodesulfobacteriota bacterium]